MNNSLVTVFEQNNTTLKEYNVRKLYLDAFQAQSTAGGQRYPQVNQAISNDIGNSLYLFYFGHGGINGWAQERVLTLLKFRMQIISPMYTADFRLYLQLPVSLHFGMILTFLLQENSL
jgi:hypothetical protein